jgi:hypothetical protein
MSDTGWTVSSMDNDSLNWKWPFNTERRLDVAKNRVYRGLIYPVFMDFVGAYSLSMKEALIQESVACATCQYPRRISLGLRTRTPQYFGSTTQPEATSTFTQESRLGSES